MRGYPINLHVEILSYYLLIHCIVRKQVYKTGKQTTQITKLYKTERIKH